MSDTSGLSKYIQKLLANSGVSKNAVSAEEYYLIHGSGAKYKSDLEKALKNEKINLPTYGAVADNLDDLGLQNSGYEDYIRQNEADAVTLARQNMQKYSPQSETALKGYAHYLENVQKNNASMRRQLLYRLTSPKAGDEETSYNLALLYGMSDEDARNLSRVATEFRESGVKNKYEIMNYIIDRGFMYDEAYAYALAMGADDDKARTIANAADKINGAQKKELIDIFSDSSDNG